MEEDADAARRRLPINTLVLPLSASHATRHLILQSSHRGDRTGITPQAVPGQGNRFRMNHHSARLPVSNPPIPSAEESEDDSTTISA